MAAGNTLTLRGNSQVSVYSATGGLALGAPTQGAGISLTSDTALTSANAAYVAAASTLSLASAANFWLQASGGSSLVGASGNLLAAATGSFSVASSGTVVMASTGATFLQAGSLLDLQATGAGGTTSFTSAILVTTAGASLMATAQLSSVYAGSLYEGAGAERYQSSIGPTSITAGGALVTSSNTGVSLYSSGFFAASTGGITSLSGGASMIVSGGSNFVDLLAGSHIDAASGGTILVQRGADGRGVSLQCSAQRCPRSQRERWQRRHTGPERWRRHQRQPAGDRQCPHLLLHHWHAV